MGDAELNVVPRNYVVDAIDYLSQHGETGAVYQLCDPNPPTIAAFTRLVADATGTRVLPVPTTRGLAKRVIGTPWGQSLTGIPSAVVDYFSHPTRYVCPNARRALAGSGISCPAFESYLDRLLAFARDHPDLDGAAMT
jgi:hypothetical protein